MKAACNCIGVLLGLSFLLWELATDWLPGGRQHNAERWRRWFAQ